MIGTVLDKYEVVQKVGEGGMATVYRGRHTTLRRDVAVKILHPHLSSSTRNRRRFAREARAIEHLRHPNILEIFDYSGEDSEECYIVTEFVNGWTLSEVLQRAGRVPSEVAARIGGDIARALACAHEAGILHRDVKPENVMIRGDGVVKLMDFGIARFLDESHVTMTGALVGSPAYMSPEQAKEADLDARSDLFSLGTLLFHLVTGHLPFSGSNPSLVLKNVIEGARPTVFELAPSTSATLADTIESLLQVDRDARPKSAAEVAKALDAALAEVGFDPNLPAWSLARFVDETEPYVSDLEAHLRTALLDHGKTYLAQGDAIGALRLFNRLLSIDGENEQVLTLVQGLHAEPPPPRGRRWPIVGLALVVAAGGLGLLAWRQDVPVDVRVDPPNAMVAAPMPSATPAVVATRPPPPTAAPPAATPPPSSSPSRPVRSTAPPRVTPTPPPPPLPSAMAPADRLSRVTVFVSPREAAVDIVCDGVVVGATPARRWFTLGPGDHPCELQSKIDLFERQSFTITATGEPVEVRRELRPRPATFEVDGSCPAGCTVARDGAVLATIADGERRVKVERPDVIPYTLQVRCPDGRRWDQRYTTAVTGDRNLLVCRGAP